MSVVLGLDLSLTSTGVCLIHPEGALTKAIKSKGKKGASVSDTCQRLANIVYDTEQTFRREGPYWPDLAVIEAPSYGSHTGSQHERGGLWWAVADMLWGLGIPIATVSPKGRAKYATGKGNTGKDEVLAAAIKRYVQFDITSNDVADAVILAAMGRRHLNEPIDSAVDSLPACLAAMSGATWPS